MQSLVKDSEGRLRDLHARLRTMERTGAVVKPWPEPDVAVLDFDRIRSVCDPIYSQVQCGEFLFGDLFPISPQKIEGEVHPIVDFVSYMDKATADGLSDLSSYRPSWLDSFEGNSSIKEDQRKIFVTPIRHSTSLPVVGKLKPRVRLSGNSVNLLETPEISITSLNSSMTLNSNSSFEENSSNLLNKSFSESLVRRSRSLSVQRQRSYSRVTQSEITPVNTSFNDFCVPEPPLRRRNSTSKPKFASTPKHSMPKMNHSFIEQSPTPPRRAQSEPRHKRSLNFSAITTKF